MIAFLPSWSTSEWTSVVATAFSAAAATAAWKAVSVSVGLQRAARVPHVSGAVLHGVPSGRLTLSFTNAGPVTAVQVVYFLVAEGQQHGGLVGDGHLGVGEKVGIDPQIVSSSEKGAAFLVWGWRDLDDNVHFRTSDWTHKRISRRRHLRRKHFKLGDMFHEMYPDVEIPGGGASDVEELGSPGGFRDL